MSDCRRSTNALFSLCLFMFLCYLGLILLAVGVWMLAGWIW